MKTDKLLKKLRQVNIDMSYAIRGIGTDEMDFLVKKMTDLLDQHDKDTGASTQVSGHGTGKN